MNTNVDKFKDLLKKATMNFSIDSVQLNISPDRIKSKMISTNRDAIVLLDMDNDVFGSLRKEHELNFSEPAQSVMPFLKLIDDDIADVRIQRDRIDIINGPQKSNIYFCSDQVVSVFTAGSPLGGIEYFVEFDIDDGFTNVFKKIKAIGSRFGKIYFCVEENKLFIETTDKNNQFSNGLRYQLSEIEHDDLTLCFNYKNFVNAIMVLSDPTDFKVRLAYVKEQDLGMCYIGNTEESEQYFLMSQAD